MPDQTPDSARDESRESNRGSWEGGYSNHSLQFNTELLEWFETRINRPIAGLSTQMKDLNHSLDRHLEWSRRNSEHLHDAVTAHVKDDHQRWSAQRRTVEKWVVRGAFALVPTVGGVVLHTLGLAF